jgi:hypothetical protein
MILKAIIDDEEYTLNVPDPILDRGEELFTKLDRDMDRGWQMSREWVPNPDRAAAAAPDTERPEQAGGAGACGQRRDQGVQGGQGVSVLGLQSCDRLLE